MQYIELFKLHFSIFDFKDNVRIDNSIIQKIKEEFNAEGVTFEAYTHLPTQFSITSSIPFTNKQVELISEHFNISPKVKNTLLQHPIATYLLAKYYLASDAKLVNHEYGTEGVNCWFDFYDEDGIEYRSHRCLTFESFELFQKFKTE